MKLRSFFLCLVSFCCTLAVAAAEAAPAAGRLRWVVLVGTATEDVSVSRGAPTGVDVSRVALASAAHVRAKVEPFLGSELSPRLAVQVSAAVRQAVREAGQSFMLVEVPPQDVTDGVLRIVVRAARLEGELAVDGARWFSERSYRDTLKIGPGDEVDAVTLQRGVDRLNRSGFRRVALAAEPGSVGGTTRLTLRTQEQRPWVFTAGYNNTGTAVTDEDRLTAGVTWGNAFGRGDVLGYTFTADPALEHSLTHSVNYATELRGGHSLVFFGAYSSVESILPEPLTQKGTSWQLGTRYGIPLRQTASGWERRVELALDFKYSDNNLEFAAIPITDNVTHVAQAGVSFALSRRRAEDNASVSATLYGSPGGLTSKNQDAAFAVSRPGASASYLYARFEGGYSRALPQGFSLALRGSVQISNGPLLGVEQLAGSGSVAVRGYRESVAFGDEGLLGSIELHAPAWTLAKAQGKADCFVFLDAGRLHNLGPQGDYTSLAGAGPGLNLAWGKYFSARAAYGWQLKEIPGLTDQGAGFGHLAATVTF